MRNYPHILSKVLRGKWAISVAKHYDIQDVLFSRLAGETRSQMDTEDDPRKRAPMLSYSTKAVIPIHGIIGRHCSSLEMDSGGCDLDVVLDMIDESEDDPTTDELIFDFRTPGGTVTGVPETAKRIRNCLKPTTAFCDSECLSAGTWLASQCDKFFITESAQVGSVGVYMMILDKSRMLEDMGVKMTPIVSGKWKLAGAPFKPLSKDEEAMFQADVDRTAKQFRSDILIKRKVAREFLEGQILQGIDAVGAGFADDVVDDFKDLL